MTKQHALSIIALTLTTIPCITISCTAALRQRKPYTAAHQPTGVQYHAPATRLNVPAPTINEQKPSTVLSPYELKTCIEKLIDEGFMDREKEQFYTSDKPVIVLRAIMHAQQQTDFIRKFNTIDELIYSRSLEQDVQALVSSIEILPHNPPVLAAAGDVKKCLTDVFEKNTPTIDLTDSTALCTFLTYLYKNDKLALMEEYAKNKNNLSENFKEKMRSEVIQSLPFEEEGPGASELDLQFSMDDVA